MKNRVAWGLVGVLAVVLVGSALVFARAHGWNVIVLDPDEAVFGRETMQSNFDDGSALIEETLGLGLIGVKRSTFKKTGVVLV
jgi:hypothetical protein